MKIFILIVICLLAPVTTKAQTAEETVMFMLYGYDKVNAPTNYPIAGGKELRLSASKMSDCVYKLNIRLEGMNVDHVLDFSNVSSFNVFMGPQGVEVVVMGANLVKEGPRPTNMYGTNGIVSPEKLERVKAAASYFRSTFCKGRAF